MPLHEWKQGREEYAVKGFSKLEVLKRLEKLGDSVEILHPMRSYVNAFENTVYYVSVRRRKE
ncbi:MAG TPA: hypothetical protein VLA13_00515 [Massilibacterium sp.]|nr:hypothetical protein [Massilibacterium sp.]